MLRPTASAEREWHQMASNSLLGARALRQQSLVAVAILSQLQAAALFQAQTRGSMSVDTPETML